MSFHDLSFFIHQFEGPWAAKAAVGSKPALIGKKLQQKYFRGPNYFEVFFNRITEAMWATLLAIMHILDLVIDIGRFSTTILVLRSNPFILAEYNAITIDAYAFRAIMNRSCPNFYP